MAYLALLLEALGLWTGENHTKRHGNIMIEIGPAGDGDVAMDILLRQSAD